MANTTAPRGLVPVRHPSGCIRVGEYSVDGTTPYAYNIFKGDPVQMTGAGRNVALAEAGNVDNIGVFGGCKYVDANGSQQFSNYWPASTTATDVVAYVYDDPNIVFEIQCDTIAVGDVGNLIDWNAGTGSTVTGNSGAYAQESTKATTGEPLRIERLVNRVDNAYGAYAKVEVTFATHARKGVVSGGGGI